MEKNWVVEYYVLDEAFGFSQESSPTGPYTETEAKQIAEAVNGLVKQLKELGKLPKQLLDGARAFQLAPEPDGYWSNRVRCLELFLKEARANH